MAKKKGQPAEPTEDVVGSDNDAETQATVEADEASADEGEAPGDPAEEGPPEGLEEEPKRKGPGELFQALIAALESESDAQQHDRIQAAAQEYLRQACLGAAVASTHNVAILYDENQLIRSDADRIYEAVTRFDPTMDTILVLYSGGGSIEAGYLVGKLCRKYAATLKVVVPRNAKSAATLIACAADEIHMGDLSELGPVDPQIGGHPALGLGNAVEWIAGVVARQPESAPMFADYLSRSLRPIDLGYYDRVVESAVQYIERLLAVHADRLERSPKEIARALVHDYKDHGFVIDVDEATGIFGPKTIVSNSAEYQFGNLIYQTLSFIERVCGYYGKKFYWVGSLGRGAAVFSVKS